MNSKNTPKTKHTGEFYDVAFQFYGEFVESGMNPVVALEKAYKLAEQMLHAAETLEITADARLFKNLIAAKDTIDEDIRLGKLHTSEDVWKN